MVAKRHYQMAITLCILYMQAVWSNVICPVALRHCHKYLLHKLEVVRPEDSFIKLFWSYSKQFPFWFGNWNMEKFFFLFSLFHSLKSMIFIRLDNWRDNISFAGFFKRKIIHSPDSTDNMISVFISFFFKESCNLFLFFLCSLQKVQSDGIEV